MLRVVTDGVDAMSFLRREGEYASESEPQLIVLDINIPKLNGIEVLMMIKADSALDRYPSRDLHDIRGAERQATGCSGRLLSRQAG